MQNEALKAKEIALNEVAGLKKQRDDFEKELNNCKDINTKLQDKIEGKIFCNLLLIFNEHRNSEST